jgi:hypothetical protein
MREWSGVACSDATKDKSRTFKKGKVSDYVGYVQY